jgi:hypothetical protein
MFPHASNWLSLAHKKVWINHLNTSKYIDPIAWKKLERALRKGGWIE